LPAGVRKEGTRTLLNRAGVAVGGSLHETKERAVAALSNFPPPARRACIRSAASKYR
jgi:hypothetical protein